MLQKDSNNIRS